MIQCTDTCFSNSKPTREFELMSYTLTVNSTATRLINILTMNPRFIAFCLSTTRLQWRHKERDEVSNHRRPDCLLNCLSGNSPITGGFRPQRPVTRKMVPFDDVIIRLPRFEVCSAYQMPFPNQVTTSWAKYLRFLQNNFSIACCDSIQTFRRYILSLLMCDVYFHT